MPGDTNPALPCPCPAHVFFSSELTLSQKYREQRQLYISLSSHIHVSLPPQQRGYSGAKTVRGLSPTNTFTQTLHEGSIFASRRLGGGWGGSGKDGREEIFPPSSHNEPIVGGAGGGIGERDRPRRQTHEAAGGDAKGSRYREFCACDLQLQCLKSPNCDGKK